VRVYPGPRKIETARGEQWLQFFAAEPDGLAGWLRLALVEISKTVCELGRGEQCPLESRQRRRSRLAPDPEAKAPASGLMQRDPGYTRNIGVRNAG
jgi:hypothetical protein